MAKKIIIISSFPICIILAVLAVVFALRLSSGQAGTGQGQPVIVVSIDSAQSQVLSLIEAGKFDEADAELDKIIATAGGNEKGQALQRIAGKFQEFGQYDKAIEVSEYVLKNWPEEDFAIWAEMTLGVSQMSKGDTASAEITTERIITHYADNSNLPQVLSIMADIYSWQRMYDKAEWFYVLVADSPAGNTLASKAKLGISQIKVLRLMEEYDFRLARQQIDSLINDFNDNEDLPKTLFRFGQELEWKERYGEAAEIFERLAETFPDSSYRQQAEFERDRLTYRMKIGEAMRAGDYNEVNSVITQMTEDFEGRRDLVSELYWAAIKHESYRDTYPVAKQMYEQIISEYPASAEAEKARLDTRRIDIRALIDQPDHNAVESEVNNLLADFAASAYLPETMYRIGEHYYGKAKDKSSGIDKQEKTLCLQNAIAIFDRVADRFPYSNMVAQSHYIAADCFSRLGEYDKAIEYFEMVSLYNPDYQIAGGAQCAVGWTYELLRDRTGVPKEAVNPLVEEAYKAALEKYPNCYVADYAAFRLAQMSVEKGDKMAAAEYYRIFLQIAYSEDSRIEFVKARIAELERFDTGAVPSGVEGLTVEGGTDK